MGPRRFLACSALALALLVPSSPPALSAQGKSLVRCDALVGFNGTAREDRFAPVILSVENPGARLKAAVSLEVTWGGRLSGSASGWTITREAVLDAGSTRRFAFTVPLPRDARRLRASVISRGVQVGSLEVELRPLTTTSRIIAGIASELSLDPLAALGGAEGSARVVYPRVDDLPQAWAGYDGVDAVIVHDTYFQQLRSDQVDALERWVVTGGVLVFTGGAAALQHEPAGFGPLLPVQVTGLTQRTGLQVGVGGSSARRIPGRVEVAESRVSRGTVLASDGDLPLVVRHRLGRGSVWFLAFDPTRLPAASWEGGLALWRTMLDRDRVPALAAADLAGPMDDAWIRAVLSASPVSFPSVPAVLLFVGAYIALLVPLLLGRPGRGLRTRVRLLLLVAVTACAGAAGWALFNRLLFRPGVQTIHAARVESRSGEALAYVTEKLAVFSASALDLQLRLATSDPVLEASGARYRDQPPWEPRLAITQAGARSLVRGIDAPRLVPRLVFLQDVIPFDVIVRVKTDGPGVQAEVSNGSAAALRACYLLVSGRAYRMGDIAAGAAVQRSFDASSAADAAAFLEADGSRAAVFRTLDETAGRRAGPARLVGWMDGSALPVSIPGAEPAGRGLALGLVSVEAQVIGARP